MKKGFVFFSYTCLCAISILGVKTLAQSTTTDQAPEFGGIIFGDGSGYTTKKVGTTTVIVPPAINLSGPRGIKELKEKVYYTVSPEKPKKGESVILKAEMYGTPVQNAEFAWVINGKTYARETGLNKITFTVSGKTEVSLIILTQEGNIVTKQWSFNPQNTLIVWESGTYTPPFYKGKSLYTPESTLALHALNLDVENPLTNVYANYTWQVDGRVKGNESGVGKSVYVYKGDLLMQEPLFQVDFSGVSSFADSLENNSTKKIDGSTKLRVRTNTSSVFTYEKTPLLGVLFNKIISDSYYFDKNETTMVSYPSYFSVNSIFGADYIWTINNSIVNRGSNSLTFKKISSNEQSKLGIEIKNKNSLLQSRDISYIIDTTTKNNSSSSPTGFGK